MLFRLKHTVAVVTHAHVLQNFYTTWVLGAACQKQRLGPKLEGTGLGEHPKIWDVLGVACQKQRLGPKLEGTGLEEHPKIWDPLHISATVEASNFRFGTQLGFGTTLP